MPHRVNVQIFIVNEVDHALSYSAKATVDYFEPGYIEIVGDVVFRSLTMVAHDMDWMPLEEDVPEHWYPLLEQQAVEALAERDEGLRDLAVDAQILARKEGE